MIPRMYASVYCLLRILRIYFRDIPRTSKLANKKGLQKIFGINGVNSSIFRLSNELNLIILSILSTLKMIKIALRFKKLDKNNLVI